MLHALSAYQVSSEALSANLQKTVFKIDKSSIAGIGQTITITHSPCKFIFNNDMRISRIGPQIKIGATASLSKSVWGIPRVLSVAIAESHKSRIEAHNGLDGSITITKNHIDNGHDALYNNLYALIKMHKSIESIEVGLEPKDLVAINIGLSFEDPKGFASAYNTDVNGRITAMKPIFPDNRLVEVEYADNLLRFDHIDRGLRE